MSQARLRAAERESGLETRCCPHCEALVSVCEHMVVLPDRTHTPPDEGKAPSAEGQNGQRRSEAGYGKIEFIRWVDSASINGGLWTDPDLIDPYCLREGGLTSETVGFVHDESPDALLVVQSRNPDRVGAALSIPKKSILERRKVAVNRGR